MLKFIGSFVYFRFILFSFSITELVLSQIKIEGEVLPGPDAGIKNEILFMLFYGRVVLTIFFYGPIKKNDEKINTGEEIHDAIRPDYDIIEQRAKSIYSIHPLCDKFKNAKF